MEDMTKGRILICLLIIVSTIGFGYLFFTEFIDVPILYVYTMPLSLYIPVVSVILLFKTFENQEVKPNSSHT